MIGGNIGAQKEKRKGTIELFLSSLQPKFKTEICFPIYWVTP
jgi:hypothetical protein